MLWHIKIQYFLSKIVKIRAKSRKKWLQVRWEPTPHFLPLWPYGHTQSLKEALRNSGLCVASPQITFVGESVIGWVTFKEELGKRVTVNEFQGIVRRSFWRSKMRKLILPFDNRFHLTCQGSHFWNRTLFDWWGGGDRKKQWLLVFSQLPTSTARPNTYKWLIAQLVLTFRIPWKYLWKVLRGICIFSCL